MEDSEMMTQSSWHRFLDQLIFTLRNLFRKEPVAMPVTVGLLIAGLTSTFIGFIVGIVISLIFSRIFFLQQNDLERGEK